MATNKQKTQKVADNDAAALGYLRKSDLSHKAEIQMLITLAEAHGINMAYNEKDGEVTVEQVAPVKESAQTQQQSFFACAQQNVTQIQRTPNQPPNQSDIDYVRLANALKEHVEKALQNAVESSPVHIQAIFDTSVHMENNQTAMTIAHEEWAKWMQAFGKETMSRLSNAPSSTCIPQGKAITFGKDTAYKMPENELDAAPNHPSEATEKQPTKHRRLHQLWSHVRSDIVTSWWKCFAYTIALCCLVLAAASWYRQSQLETVVKEYYIIKPLLKQDRKYAPLIHTMDSVILKDGIDEVCERVYGEKL
ncbi:MAG: hypothetical protein IKQ37_12165 [Bacteroidaceae bacterium]|nr:hypothetical protein [Bacteroidaceae bacterium]